MSSWPSPFEATRTEQEVFDDLQRLCGSKGYIHVLAVISHRDNFLSYTGMMTSEVMAASYATERTIRTEFSTLMGLMLKSPVDFANPGAAAIQHMLERTGTLLSELHACLNQPMMESFRRAIEGKKAGLDLMGLNPFVQADVLREPIFYGGESAYNFQYRELAKDRYALDDVWLLENYGFKITDAHSLAQALPRLLIQKLLATFDNLKKVDPSIWTLLPGFIFSLDEISAECGLELEVAEAILRAFTAPGSPANESFQTLSDFNIINARPIIKMPTGLYACLQSYNVDESLYESPFFWMACDDAYKNSAFAHRGAFTESFVAKCLADIFSPSRVHCNVEIKRGNKRLGEIDVLVLYGDRALVVQCKSKRLTIEARKGNDLQLRNDFKKSVQDSYDQAYLCSRLLQDTSVLFEKGDGSTVPITQLAEIYPVCVVSDHYPALAVQAREFLNSKSDEVIQPPLVTDVFLIDVLTEMLASPLWLLSYINRRVNYNNRVNAINELTILSYHLKQNLWLDEKFDLVTLSDDIAIDLDTAFTVRRQGLEGEKTPEGILTHLEGTLVGRMIKSIEHSSDPELINLGFMLLTLGGDTLKQLDSGLKEIAQQTRRDGFDHDFTLAFNEGGDGLTVHCGTSRNAEAAEKLARHCHLRKYAHRAQRWYGLAVRAEDGMPKFGLNLDSPWKQDAGLDEATEGMTLRGNWRKGAPISMKKKIGRNEQCRCGSGKKFKKCCLNKQR